MVKTILIKVFTGLWKGKEETYIKYENEKKFQNYLNTLDEGFEDFFVYLAIANMIQKKLQSKNITNLKTYILSYMMVGKKQIQNIQNIMVKSGIRIILNHVTIKKFKFILFDVIMSI